MAKVRFSLRGHYVAAGVMLWLTSGMAVSAIVLLIGMLGLLCWLAFAGDAFGAAAGHFPGALAVLSQGEPPYTAEALFSAIVGTITVTLLMTLLVAPLGILVAVYLHVYARQHWYTDLVRIAIHNLAGVPSIIYGVFGLGFFVYWVGGGIDELFFFGFLAQGDFWHPRYLVGGNHPCPFDFADGDSIYRRGVAEAAGVSA